MKEFLHTAGFLIFAACDGLAQGMIRQAERSGRLFMEKIDYTERYKTMVEKVISFIEKDTPTEFVFREVDMLTEIHSCVKKPHETTAKFANRFNETVARYAVHSGELDAGMDRQLAVLMLKNFKLTIHTMNALTFKLTIMENTEKLEDRREYLPVYILKRAVRAIEEDPDITAAEVVDEIKQY